MINQADLSQISSLRADIQKFQNLQRRLTEKEQNEFNRLLWRYNRLLFSQN